MKWKPLGLVMLVELDNEGGALVLDPSNQTKYVSW
jgi:hypothetical protein